MSRTWRVVGGADKGGILVREAQAIGSPQTMLRLSHGACVQEIELVGERLHYQLISGMGPSSGWVSTKLKDKPLLVLEEDSQGTESLFTYIEVSPSEKHGTLRDVKSGIEELEKRAQECAKKCQPGPQGFGPQAAPSLKDSLEDLLYIARRRDSRNRIISFIGNLLKDTVKDKCSIASDIICWKLCLVSWASSLQDVLYFPMRDDSKFVVLLFGFGGSHMNDLHPAAERWSTNYGAAVLAVGPVMIGRADVWETVYGKLMELLSGGRKLVLHWCSDGGFEAARSFLMLWLDKQRRNAEAISPSDVLQCIISDSAGLGNGHSGIVKDGTYMDGQEELFKDEAKVKKVLNSSALGFFVGCAFNMFMHSGACMKFYEEPANSFGQALGDCIDRNVVWNESRSLESILWSVPELQDVFEDVPILAIGSKGDKIVTIDRTIFLAESFRRLPCRNDAILRRWGDTEKSVIGKDGDGVHELVFEKVGHCKGFISQQGDYWEAVDKLVQSCMSSSTK